MAAELTIIGVGHVFNIAEKVKSIIIKKNPHIVAVELDYGRAKALTEGNRKGMEKGNLLYYVLAKLQKRISRKFGVESGKEMLAAMEAAKEIGAETYFIDMDANMVIKKLWSSISFKRKIQILASSLLSMFFSRKTITKEVERFEENPDLYLDEMERAFPEFKRILIDERNKFMAEYLKNILRDGLKILVVVGEGHVEGLKNLMEEENVTIEAIHLTDLLKS